MKNKLLFLPIIFFSFFVLLCVVSPNTHAANSDCNKSKRFFGLPTWYEFLEFDQNCEIKINPIRATTTTDASGKKVSTVDSKYNFKDIWLITLAIVDILITLSGLLAVFYIISGSFQFVISQAEPEKVVKARKTVLYAVVGLIVAVIASRVVAFIAGFLQ